MTALTLSVAGVQGAVAASAAGQGGRSGWSMSRNASPFPALTLLELWGRETEDTLARLS